MLRSDSPPVNRSLTHYQYIHCLAALGRSGQAAQQAQEFLRRFPVAPERPEVQFVCAASLKEARHDGEALRQVLSLLEEQHTNAAPDPETLAYWQRRAGNQLANSFYLDGDCAKALDIYLCLAALDTTPEWQLPVWYQIALVFERLRQPPKAIEYLQRVLSREKELPPNAPASLKTVIEMAKWRNDFLTWHTNAEATSLELRHTLSGSPKTNATDHLPPTTASHP